MASKIAIPDTHAEFIEDIDAFMKGKEADSVIMAIKEKEQRYRMVEHQLLQRKAAVTRKIPDLQKALDMLEALIARAESEQELLVDYELADGVLAKAKVQQPQTVALWLGANVMLEYPLEEANEVRLIAKCILHY
jgi:prefoldin subunit 5